MADSGVVSGGVRFDAVAARDAATRLDGLADRLEEQLRTGEPSLQVAPAGLDEVSLRAAQTMTGVAISFSESASAGVLELRKLAALLRSQVQEFGRAEADNVESLGGTNIGAA